MLGWGAPKIAISRSPEFLVSPVRLPVARVAVVLAWTPASARDAAAVGTVGSATGPPFYSSGRRTAGQLREGDRDRAARETERVPDGHRLRRSQRAPPQPPRGTGRVINVDVGDGRRRHVREI